MRIATFNLENLDSADRPALERRVKILRPQLRRIDADILCLQEIHSQADGEARTLEALDILIADTQYADFSRVATSTTDGDLYYRRNLVTLSRYPVSESRSIRGSDGPQPMYRMATADPPDQEANTVDWERPLLYSEVLLPDNEILYLVNLHFKSKRPTSVPGGKLDPYTWRTVSAWAEGNFLSAMKRVGQALQTRLLVDSLFDSYGTEAAIAVCGDFNADLDDVPMLAIRGPVEETGNPAHSGRLLIPCEYSVADSRRFSLLHLGKRTMLDHILVSRRLHARTTDCEIHNEALPDESGAFRTDRKFPESDHAPVIASFRDFDSSRS